MVPVKSGPPAAPGGTQASGRRCGAAEVLSGCEDQARIKQPALPLLHWASLVAQTVKSLSAVRETWVPSLGWEAPLEEEMATHSSVLAWRILWTGAWWAAWGPKGLEGKGEKERYTH